MANAAETIAISRALLALSTAVNAMQKILVGIVPEENEEALKNLDASASAIDELLSDIQKLVGLIEKNNG
jgi:hypothetical protein